MKILICSEDRAVGVVIQESGDECGEVGTFEVKALRDALAVAEDLGYSTVRLGWLTDNVTGGTNLTVTGEPKTWESYPTMAGTIVVAPATVAEVDD